MSSFKSNQRRSAMSSSSNQINNNQPCRPSNQINQRRSVMSSFSNQIKSTTISHVVLFNPSTTISHVVLFNQSITINHFVQSLL
ncbi:hypothetical protein RHMOL_Rhmol08G0177300 [Rhododendron molle]|uniref:Uncharacterized protein n=1 Tax=Rhododendron molle TaxID=49168 RepID=A0ACC0MPQ9_RHOML|nr:hypothetical protein RHMOL_Rhmol08G0177300 [Rhododendron molle]